MYIHDRHLCMITIYRYYIIYDLGTYNVYKAITQLIKIENYNRTLDRKSKSTSTYYIFILLSLLY